MKNLTFSILLSVLTFSILNAQVFDWAGQLGGNLVDESRGITLSSSGDIYTTGSFRETADLDPGVGVYELETTNGMEVFVSKLDPAGDFVWARKVIGGSHAIGNSIAVDPSDNILITGERLGIFVSKINPAGNILWTREIDGSNFDRSNSVTTDNSGSVLFTGSFYNTADFDPGPDTFNLTSVGNKDMFISKLDANGNFIWAKAFSGISHVEGMSLTVDTEKNIYATGCFRNSVDFDPGPGSHILDAGAGSDIFVLKLDGSGNFLWVKQLNGESENVGNSISLDHSGNILLTGTFYTSVDFDPGPSSYDLTTIGTDFNADAFILKLNANGEFIWARQLGKFEHEIGNSIDHDDHDNIYCVGSFAGTVDFDPASGVQNLISSGGRDAFLTKFDENGHFVWAKKMGGSTTDKALALTVDTESNVYCTGEFTGTADFDPMESNFTMTTHGGTDVFISKFKSCLPSFSILDAEACESYTSPSGDHTWEISGTYIDVVSNANGCDSMITINLTVSTPTASVTQSGGYLTAIDENAFYQWVNCDDMSPVEGATGQIFGASDPGSYAVTITQNECIVTSACYSVTSVGIGDISQFGEISLYPNPTEGYVSIDLGNQVQELNYRILDISGRQHMQSSVRNLNTLNLFLDFESGMYIIHLESENERIAFPVILR